MTTKLDLTQFEGHTPGPWEATRRDDGNGNWKDCIIEQAMNYGGLRVARVERVDNRGFLDACLLAAAPALLALAREQQEQIRVLREALVGFTYGIEQMNLEDGWREEMTRARAALKATEGA